MAAVDDAAAAGVAAAARLAPAASPGGRSSCSVTGWIAADRILEIGESNLYADDVVLARNTPYQRIVLTAWKDDLRLFLNSHLQFSSKDEYRYHEALVHPGLSAQPEARRVLVLGGGDGLAVREILKHPRIEHVTLVDLDPEMTHLFSTHPELTKLNHGAFADPRVHVVNADAFAWLEETHDLYDFAVVDFPDPSNYSIGKLYTTAFYGALARHLPPDGRFVVQSTSPLFARKSFWCVVQTVEATRADGIAVSRLRARVRRVGVRHRRPDAVRVGRRLFHRICASSRSTRCRSSSRSRPTCSACRSSRIASTRRCSCGTTSRNGMGSTDTIEVRGSEVLSAK